MRVSCLLTLHNRLSEVIRSCLTSSYAHTVRITSPCTHVFSNASALSHATAFISQGEKRVEKIRKREEKKSETECSGILLGHSLQFQ